MIDKDLLSEDRKEEQEHVKYIIIKTDTGQLLKGYIQQNKLFINI